MPGGEPHPKATYVLGCDFARLGEDETVLIILEQPWGENKIVYCVYIEIISKMPLTHAHGRIVRLHEKFHFKKIYLDETGMGAGPSDYLREQLGSIIEPITFTIQSKEDMYSNLKILMESGRLKLPPHKKLIHQLQELMYETTSSGHIKIHHRDRGFDDLADSLALAAYHFKPRRAYVPHVYIPTGNRKA